MHHESLQPIPWTEALTNVSLCCLSLPGSGSAAGRGGGWLYLTGTLLSCRNQSVDLASEMGRLPSWDPPRPPAIRTDY